jgi:preprotein translocase subunit SecG
MFNKVMSIMCWICAGIFCYCAYIAKTKYWLAAIIVILCILVTWLSWRKDK